MKAITIKQPWASLIVHGIKNIENRTWPCPKKYLGQKVLIHSSVCHGKKFKINLTDEQMKQAFWDYPGIKEVSIECPECGSIEIAVEDYTTAPFPTYLHRCNKCEHVIMESEWNITR